MKYLLLIRRRLWPLVLSFAVLLGAACENDDPSVAETVAPASAPPATSSVVSVPPALSLPPGPRGQPQPKLATMKLWVGTNQVQAEIAMTENQIRTGMMWRTNMAEMEGMLFVFPAPQRVAFYMKNTLLPLSCAYIDPDGMVLELHDMKPLDESSIVSDSDQVQYVLEMNRGWFERHGIRPGMAVSTDQGNFSQVFSRR
jgi:uncharacterized protein